MAVTEHVSFNIPSGKEDTEGMRIAALVMPDRNDTLRGFLSLPGTVSAEHVEVVITAMRAALFDLEDNCHNHPTQPMRVSGASGDEQ